MTKRGRKIVARVVMVAAGLFVIYLLASFCIVSPAGELAAREARLRRELRLLDRKNDREARYLAMLGKYAAATYGDDPVKVSEDIRVRLDRMVEASGMRRDGTARPVTGRSRPNAYREIGWQVDLVGTLGQAVDLLYVLQKDPYVHRLEGLSIVPQRDGRAVDLAFRYMTIVLDEALLEMQRKVGGTTKTIRMSTNAVDEASLPGLADNPGRAEYGLIAARNIFRPYIQKKSRPDTPVARKRSKPAPSPRKSDRNRFKVVSLTDWGDCSDISVKDTETGTIRRYNLGDPLAGGKIVMVDYRIMPRPDDPELLSTSRVIMRLGEDYVAIELGESLASKHRLDAAQLPEELRRK
ncbi:MAG: hypothetical protein GVY16_08880 [Planctomycetes bacterium]|jgi:hypothetical protein|nr:hypothetical protein [Planctomycetota bacterium]